MSPIRQRKSEYSKSESLLRIILGERDILKKHQKWGEYLRGVDELLINFQNMAAEADSFETFERRVSICI